MGIAVKFSPELALRDFSKVQEEDRLPEECVPENLQEGETYEFLKKGQRIYWLNEDPYWKNGEMPLVKTEGNEKTSSPIASIKMLEVTHFIKDKEIYTKGKYKIIKLIPEGEIYFNSVAVIK